MNRFFTSDWHLGHQRVIELCDRPFGSVEEMNQSIIDAANDVAGPNDELWILGDVIMGSFAENVRLLEQVRARIIMYSGNHDRTSLAYHHNGDAAGKRARFARMYQDAGVAEIYDENDHITVVMGGRILNVAHFPYEGDSHDKDRYDHLRLPDTGVPLLCGHVHDAWDVQGHQFNVGVDVRDFAPVPEDEIREWLGTLS